MNLTNTRIQNTYGGLLNIGSQGLTGSQPISDGFGNVLPIEVSDTNVNFTGTVSGLTIEPYYGVFYDDNDQSIAVINTPQVVQITNTEEANGIGIVSGSKITINNPRKYSMAVTFLVQNLSGNPEDLVFWLKFNGTDYPRSAHFMTAPARKSAGVPSQTIVNFNFIGTSTRAGDYVEIYWQGTSTALTLKQTRGAGYPDSDSVYVTIHSI